nr:hypothetical protein CFP56_70585 [Quercus suber]
MPSVPGTLFVYEVYGEAVECQQDPQLDGYLIKIFVSRLLIYLVRRAVEAASVLGLCDGMSNHLESARFWFSVCAPAGMYWKRPGEMLALLSWLVMMPIDCAKVSSNPEATNSIPFPCRCGDGRHSCDSRSVFCLRIAIAMDRTTDAQEASYNSRVKVRNLELACGLQPLAN